MSARGHILSAVRAGLGTPRKDPEAIAAEAAALLAEPDAIRPRLSASTLVEAFSTRATALGTTLDRIADFTYLPAAVGRYLTEHGLGAAVAVEPAAGADSEPDVHEDYVSAYDLGRFAESARFVRHYPEQNPVLRDLLPSITTPAQIVAGRDDDLVPWSNNQYLADLLPNSEIHPLDAGHFAWEQASDEYGRLIVEWVTGGFQRLGGAVTA